MQTIQVGVGAVSFEDVCAVARDGAAVSLSPQALEAIDLARLFDLNAMVATRGASMAQGDFAPSFELAMARKDFGLMLETAGGRPLAVLPGIAARMDQLIAAGQGAADVTSLARDALAR